MFSLDFNINFIESWKQQERKASIFPFIEQRFHVFLINKMKTINQNLLMLPFYPPSLAPRLLEEVCSSILMEEAAARMGVEKPQYLDILSNNEC